MRIDCIFLIIFVQDAYSRIFTAANGDRAGVPNIVIVITDGQSTNKPSTKNEAKRLRDHGAQVHICLVMSKHEFVALDI